MRLLAIVAALVALAPASQAESLRLTQPEKEQPLFGVTLFAAELSSSVPIYSLEILLDGSRIARFRRPPFRVEIDVGQANIDHRVVVRADTLFGQRLEIERIFPAVAVDAQIDVDLVQAFASVSIWDGRTVASLGPRDFQIVSEDGDRTPAVTVAHGDLPLSIALLVDSSESMQGRLELAIQGALAVTPKLREEDEMQIILFSDRLLRTTPFTSHPDPLVSALDDAAAGGGTAVRDALYYALVRLRPRLNRPIVIFFSDGLDGSSRLDAEALRRRVRHSQATLFWIRVGEEATDDAELSHPRYRTIWHPAEENERAFQTLVDTVRETGGDIVTIPGLRRLGPTLGSIVESLRDQLVLGFEPPDRRHDGSWRPLHIEGSNTRMKITTRAGYIDR